MDIFFFFFFSRQNRPNRFFRELFRVYIVFIWCQKVSEMELVPESELVDLWEGHIQMWLPFKCEDMRSYRGIQFHEPFLVPFQCAYSLLTD